MRHKKLDPPGALRRQRRLRKLVYALLETFHFVAARAERAVLVEWAARKYLRDSIKDPKLRAGLTPDYKLNCKPVVQSNKYFPAISSANVDFVASGLAEIREKSIVADDGREFEVDTIVWGTGFNTGHSEVMNRIRGRGGIEMSGTDRAYKATTMVGCPNMFVIVGPNGVSATAPFTIEAQAEYVASAIRTMRRSGVEAVEVRSDAEREWNRRTDAKLAGSVWNAGGCMNYFLNDRGVNNAAWPGSIRNMRRQLRSFDIDNYLVTPAVPSGTGSGAV